MADESSQRASARELISVWTAKLRCNPRHRLIRLGVSVAPESNESVGWMSLLRLIWRLEPVFYCSSGSRSWHLQHRGHRFNSQKKQELIKSTLNTMKKCLPKAAIFIFNVVFSTEYIFGELLKVCVKIGEKSDLFAWMHLADTLIQSDFHCIQIHQNRTLDLGVADQLSELESYWWSEWCAGEVMEPNCSAHAITQV